MSWLRDFTKRLTLLVGTISLVRRVVRNIQAEVAFVLSLVLGHLDLEVKWLLWGILLCCF